MLSHSQKTHWLGTILDPRVLSTSCRPPLPRAENSHSFHFSLVTCLCHPTEIWMGYWQHSWQPEWNKKPEACLRYMTINLLSQKPGREFPEAGKWPECKKSPLWFGVYGKSEGRCPGISDPINVQSSTGSSREMTRACLPSAAFLSRVRRFHLTWDTSDLNYFPWQGECVSCLVVVIPLSSEEVLGLHRT